MTTHTRFLPIQPIRDALINRRSRESYRVMATRWAESTDRSVRTCQRLLVKFLHDNVTISEANADEVCMYVLMSSGVAVYGVDGWSTDGHQSHD